MSDSGDKRWEEKDDGISTLLREQNEELIKKYEHQCQISKDLAKENEELFYSQMTEALSQMLSRGMISDNNDGVIVVDENRDLLQFYANSLDSSDRAKVIKV